MKKNGLKVLLAIILSLTISACSSSGVAFDYKIKPEYANKFTSEDAAILIDFLKVASDLPDAANANKEEYEVEQMVIDMGDKAIDHFSKKDGDISLELATSINLIAAVALDIKMAKAKHKGAKLDEKMGVESKYKDYLDIKERMKQKRQSSEESLLEFKKYVD